MKARRRLILVLLLVGAFTAGRLFANDFSTPTAPPWDRFVTNRPRLFVSAESLSSVTQAAARAHGAWLNGVRDHMGRLAVTTNLPAGDYGVESAAAAFLFLCERTPARLSVATGLLERSVAYYSDCDRDRRTVNHYSATRIHAIMAYDWLYDAMPEEQRVCLGRALLAHVAHRVLDRPVPGDNQSDYRSGFYGEISLPWYIGIATRGTGIDEPKSAAGIAFGYEQQMRMLEHRRRLAGDDGGDATATLGYALRADPAAEFNFFHTLRSAFGLEAAPLWPHVALLPAYALWNRLPGGLEFGAGDAFHVDNRFPDEHLYTHLAQVRHFFGRSRPEQAALAAWLQDRCRPPAYSPTAPLIPFLLMDLDCSPPARPPPADAPRARQFTGLGQILMRSGWDTNDTYALFTAGGQCDRHKHFDENTFAIYHKGFLALDSGTRPVPGNHLLQYYCRTVAHNGVLIRMDGETLPPYWGTPAPGEPVLPIANDGGMRSPTGAVIRAFHTTPTFTYIASDATACYHPGKCREAVRQFVHLQPNRFVVFDRITTVRPDQPVTWILHTAREPAIEGLCFRADEGDGRLWCRTLLPLAAALHSVGGPGKEFWSDGRNWPLPDRPGLGGEKIRRPELLGGWRVEVSPSGPSTSVRFLHVLEAVDAPAATNGVAARLLGDGNWTGVEIGEAGRTAIVRFAQSGEIGCEIRVSGGTTNVAANLLNTIQAQSEWKTSEP